MIDLVIRTISSYNVDYPIPKLVKALYGCACGCSGKRSTCSERVRLLLLLLHAAPAVAFVLLFQLL